MDKKRVDILLSELGYSKSRTYSKELIKQNRVYYNNKLITKPSIFVDKEGLFILEGKDYVSRGAFKLLKAIQVFGLDISEKTCMDIGASTGGFTQVLIENGAKIVYALDVGSNQLDKRLRNNKKIISIENTNIKEINIEKFNNLNLDIVTVDISFISIIKILDILDNISNYNTKFIILIKPQFESKALVSTKGILNKKYHYNVIRNIIIEVNKKNFNIYNLDYSPIKGKDGNIEYLLYIGKEEKTSRITDLEIRNTIESAFENKEK